MATARSPVTTDIDFEREGKQVGYLRVPHSRNTSAWGSVLVPVVVVQNGSGPTVLLVGGMHGGEYEGPVSLNKLAQRLAPEAVEGRVILLPSLNLPAVQVGQRLSPIDGKDMNRVFPGRPDGTLTEILAHYVYEEILPLCDAVLDIHAGGYSLELAPYISMHYLEDEAQMAATRAALEAFQAPYALIMEEFSGEGLLDYAVESMGKIFLCAELGGAGRLSPFTLQLAEVGALNLLRHFGIVEGEIERCADRGLPPMQLMEVPDAKNYHVVMEDGIYETFYEVGDGVEIGQPLGQVHFAQHPDRPPMPVVAQRGGVLIGRRGPGFVEVGDTVAVVAQEVDADR
ncbi:MAG: succinylglutamate desuccinylase/aspartoacylase family protein [Candidatus Promineifilaceae bacterium]|nr:succinylglutamate desuccinylase/aspartoacylase family protein [Candidatus Promineifilaceae bacterium]